MNEVSENIPNNPTQLDRIEAMLVELVQGKRELEQALAAFQENGPMSLLQGLL